MRVGDTPIQIINWLVENDAQNNSSIRQYGIVGFTGDNVSAAGFTGVNTDDYKNHITGNIGGIYYSIQGNILLGQEILDSMEYRFRNESGDLACKLMAALQGAKVVGADTRCAPDGTSTLFAFLKVAKPDDTSNNPSFSIGVRTRDNTGIEPIDSLQAIFNSQHSCTISTVHEPLESKWIQVYPNPASNEITIKADPSLIGSQYIISNSSGKDMMIGTFIGEIKKIDIHRFVAGMYVLRVGSSHRVSFVKN